MAAVATILLALVGVVLVVVVVGLRRRVQRERVARTEASTRAAGLERELASAHGDVAAATARAEMAERRTESEAEARRAAEARARTADEALVMAEAAADVDVEELWAMELARSERTWRWSVAADPTGPTPWQDGEDPLRAAVEVEAAAWREESGTHVELDWNVPDDLPTAVRLVALRSVQEELAAVVKSMEHAVVRGDLDGGTVRVRVEAAPPGGGTAGEGARAEDAAAAGEGAPAEGAPAEGAPAVVLEAARAAGGAPPVLEAAEAAEAAEGPAAGRPAGGGVGGG